MHIHWFPGHMAKARRMMEDHIKKVDVIIELLDARIPRSSANPMIRELVGNKPHVVLLNKVDLADPKVTKEWIQFFKGEGIDVITVDAKTGRGQKELLKAVEKKSAPIIERWTKKGMKARAVRTMILGIPNVGKSTLINSLAGRAAAAVADKAGKTRGQQWVRIGKNLELLDTPGVLWPKLEDQRAAARLAFTGALSDDVYDLETVTNWLFESLMEQVPELVKERYKLTGEEDLTTQNFFELMGKKRGALLPGGIVDMEKARRILLGDYRDMRLGKLSFDTPHEETYFTSLEEAEEMLRRDEAAGKARR